MWVDLSLHKSYLNPESSDFKQTNCSYFLKLLMHELGYQAFLISVIKVLVCSEMSFSAHMLNI